MLNVFLLLSLGGSLRALTISAETGGITSVWAFLYWVVDFTVIFRTFQSPVALAMSSPTFFGDRSRRLILGARADVALTSPLGYLGISLVGVELRWYGRACWCQMNPDSGWWKKVAPWLPLIWKCNGCLFVSLLLAEIQMWSSWLAEKERMCYSNKPSMELRREETDGAVMGCHLTQ